MSDGLRKRRTHFFVQVPRDTIRDCNLSFRARGVLGYLLDQADGFDVRSEYIASQARSDDGCKGEGREAVRTALHELGRFGYYRLERRRLRDGRMVMGTSLSEEPVASWAEEYAEFDGKAVPCIQQKDGSFKVQRKDGRLVDDGFASTESDDPEPSSRQSDDSASTVDGDHLTGAQKAVPGDIAPGPRNPASGEPAPGPRGAIREKEKGEATRETTPGALAPLDAPEHPHLVLVGEVVDAEAPQPVDAKKARHADAHALVTAWMDYCKTQTGCAIVDSSRKFHALVKNIVTPALAAGYADDQIKAALVRCGVDVVLPSPGQFQRNLVAVAGTHVATGKVSERRQSNDDILAASLARAQAREAQA